jgi:uncharacterized spore protein YtfJ
MDVDQIVQGARDALTVKRVFGEPYEKDGVTIIPAAAFRGGGGGGGDNSPNGGGGGGFGLDAKPAGAYVIRNGQVSWQPAVDLSKVFQLAIAALIVLRTLIKSRAKTRIQKAKRKA